MFEFIKIEDIKSLCTHVVENFATTLDKITYVQVISRFRYLSSNTSRFWLFELLITRSFQTFKALRMRYDQHQDRMRWVMQRSLSRL